MIFYFYGTCNQKATIIQFQKLKEKAKSRRAEEGHSGSDRFCCRIQRSRQLQVVFLGVMAWYWHAPCRRWEQLHRCNEKPVRGYGDGGYDGFVLSWLLSWLVIRLNIWYIAVLHDFQRFYKLESYTVKEIDQYLWQLGKANFPKKYWRCVYGKRKKRAKRLNGGDVHFVKTTVTPPPWLALPLIEQKYHFVQLLSMRPKTASGYFEKVSFPF